MTLHILLALLAAVACYTDWKWRRIPNWLTVGALAGALVLHGATGLKTAAQGAGLAAALTLPFFIVRGLGGGDVKLMVAAGAIIGPTRFIELFILNAILGGVAALVVLAGRGRWGRTARNIGEIFATLTRGRSPHATNPDLDIGGEKSVTLPRGVIFAVAVLLTLASGRWTA